MTRYEEKRYKMVKIGAYIGIIGNIILALVKGVVGIVAESRALIADAIHSASDVISSIAVFIGVRAAKRPPDRDHPYGHGKAETLTAIIVAVLLFLVGAEIGIEAMKDIGKEATVPHAMALIAVIFSIVVKEGMFHYKYQLGKKYKSDALITDAWHHRSDAFSSIAAFVGIGASLLGDWIDVSWLLYGDVMAGLFVAILIMRMAWKLGKDSIHNVLDHVLHEEDTKEMREIVIQVDGVRRIDEFFAREHGYYVIVDIKIAVDPSITVEEGHAIAKNVKEALLTINNVKDVFVHVNPDVSPEKRSE